MFLMTLINRGDVTAFAHFYLFPVYGILGAVVDGASPANAGGGKNVLHKQIFPISSSFEN